MILAAVVFASGCGKQERIEAVQLSQVLEKNQANLATANSVEKEFVSGLRGWAGDIIANGAGRGAQLDQNSTVAAQLAKSAAEIGAELGRVRQSFYDLSLKQEYPQTVRDGLITQLATRQGCFRICALRWNVACPSSWTSVTIKPMWATRIRPASRNWTPYCGLTNHRRTPSDPRWRTSKGSTS